MAASSSSFATKSFCHSLKRFVKAPWEITGPCSDPDYRIALPMTTEYRRFSLPTAPAKACVPTADTGTVFDINYYIRDRRRDRPPVRRTVLKKADVEKMMSEKAFGAADFPPVYLAEKVQEDDNARTGGYQK